MVAEQCPANRDVFCGRANTGVALHAESLNIILHNAVVVF
jgi:hypothetical protein